MTRIRASEWIRWRDSIADTLAKLTDKECNEMARRQAIPLRRDGYPAGGSPEGTSKNAVSRPTEATVLSHYDDDGNPRRAEPDPQGKAIETIHTELAMIHREAKVIARALDLLEHITEDRRGRESSLQGQCQACDRDVAGSASDRIRAGYCHACFTAWTRASRPDRLSFENARRIEIESETVTTS